MFMRSLLFWMGLMILASVAAAESLEPPAYRQGKDVAGTITSVGSDTMAPLLARWSDNFRRQHPKVEFSIEAKGSGTAAAALVEGRSQIAPMSRPMNPGEVAMFGAKYGYPPIGLRVAFDAIAIYVHPDNPIRGLSLEQLDGIFSAHQRCGGKRIKKWNELLPKWRNDSIVTEGRNKLSGTHDFFRSHVLCDGDFEADYHDEPDSASVVWKVATTPNAIGYAGVGYLTAKVKTVPLARRDGDPYIPFHEEGGARIHDDPWRLFKNVTSGQYPLSRFLFIYINKPPKKSPEPVVTEFLRFVLSKEGQDAVKESGFIPIDKEIAVQQHSKLDSSYSKPWWETD